MYNPVFVYMVIQNLTPKIIKSQLTSEEKGQALCAIL